MPDLKSRLRTAVEAHPEAAGDDALRAALAEIDALEAAGTAELDGAEAASLLGRAAADLRDAATICLHTGEEGRAARLLAGAEALEACLPRRAGRPEAEAAVDTVIDMLAGDDRDPSTLEPDSVVGMASWILTGRFDPEELEGIVRAKLARSSEGALLAGPVGAHQ